MDQSNKQRLKFNPPKSDDDKYMKEYIATKWAIHKSFTSMNGGDFKPLKPRPFRGKP